MSTHSSISVLNKDGTVHAIYCHSDGYLSRNGVFLYLYYQDVDKVKELVALGDMSFLERLVHPSPNSTHNYNNREPGVCMYFGRDRGEDNVDTQKYESIENYMKNGNFQEYDYIFHEKKNDWYLINHKTQKLQKLTTILKNNDSVPEDIKSQIIKELEIKKQFKILNNKLPPKNDKTKSLKI